jgi:hypothetical protein
MEYDITSERVIMHKQMIIIPNKAHFVIELSHELRKFYIIVKRKLLGLE